MTTTTLSGGTLRLTNDLYGPHIPDQIIKEALHPYPTGLHIVPSPCLLEALP